MNTRPNLNQNITLKDFREFYWLKKELIDFCKRQGIPSSGGKMELAQRIEEFIDTRKVTAKVKSSKVKSKFDWKSEPLQLSTPITDNYKNTENVRQFFVDQIGTSFKFKVPFMNWMKAQVGKKLGDAIQEWKRIKQIQKDRTQPKVIAPQFEYNRYLRDFLADNPYSTKAEAIKYWKIKKSQRGDNVYKKSDLRKRF